MGRWMDIMCQSKFEGLWEKENNSKMGIDLYNRDCNNPFWENMISAIQLLHILLGEYRIQGKKGIFPIGVLGKNFCQKLCLSWTLKYLDVQILGKDIWGKERGGLCWCVEDGEQLNLNKIWSLWRTIIRQQFWKGTLRVCMEIF